MCIIWYNSLMIWYNSLMSWSNILMIWFNIMKILLDMVIIPLNKWEIPLHLMTRLYMIRNSILGIIDIINFVIKRLIPPKRPRNPNLSLMNPIARNNPMIRRNGTSNLHDWRILKMLWIVIGTFMNRSFGEPLWWVLLKLICGLGLYLGGIGSLVCRELGWRLLGCALGWLLHG
jgi:hypothetical protein